MSVRMAWLSLLLLLTACGPSNVDERNGLTVAAALGGDEVSGYSRAIEARDFVFPHDHGPHPDFRNEWWYVTGNLQADDGRRFGFQATFFRVAIAPGMPASTSRWATNQVWMAHFALTDVAAGRHHAFERFARGAAGLAGAGASPFAVWLEDWRMASIDGDGFPWRLRLAEQGIALDLTLDPRKPIALQGDRGLSQKSAEPGNASYYYSATRLAAEGSVTSNGATARVDGLAWLDREWSTSALGPDQTGWDWFALQLDDGTDLMYYRMRRHDGSADPHSKGLWVAPDGGSRRLSADDVELEVLDRWRSPHTGKTYPSRWRLKLLPSGREFVVTPLVEEQEMRLTVHYWEGAVEVTERPRGRSVGRGYVELAGY